jgi:hypothetical protein
MRTLVLVAGHAIPRHFDRLDQDDGWYLKHFQQGEGGLYVDHVRVGVELAAGLSESVLVFAGGQTDPAAGPRSEGQGYWLVAEHYDWFGQTAVRDRATTEEFSLDSFQNVLFGLCRFKEVTGQYPEKLIAVGWKFKGARFDLHREAVRFPAARYEYVGVNDPPELERNLPFEAQRKEMFQLDPYGAGEEPVSKRLARNAGRRQHGYGVSCPELSGLLSYKGPQLYRGRLPWDSD